MSEHDSNDIDARLREMQPAKPDPALKQRIAHTLSGDPAEAHRPLFFFRPIVVGLAAAVAMGASVLFAVLLLSPPSGNEVVILEPPPDANPLDSLPAGESTQPTLFALTQAWNQSPELLDELLDRPDRSNNRFANVLAQSPTLADAEQWSLLKELP